MRVATNTTADAAVAQIQKLSVRQSQLQTQISTGQRITQSSDDPSAMARVLALQAEQAQNNQYQSNASRALDVSQATYSGLQSIKTISDRAGEIGTLGAGAVSPDAAAAYAKELNQLIEQAVQLGNSKFGNDYLFAGTKVDVAPITTTRDSNGDITVAAYAGNSSQAGIQLSDSSSISPGTTSATNNGIKDFINNLVALRDALRTTTGTGAAVSAAQPGLEASENLLVNSLSEHGAIELRIEVAQKQQTSRSTNIEKLISNEANADLATTAVKLSQTSTAYQAALSSSAKILQMSLLDYLK
jgi:flagellar hook-associated protein 3 FlgL